MLTDRQGVETVGLNRTPFYQSLWFRIMQFAVICLVTALLSLALYDVNSSVRVGPTDFDTAEALKVIKEISKTSHSVNSPDNIRVFNYLHDRVTGLKKEAAQDVEIVVQRRSLVFDRLDTNHICDVRNLLVLVNGSAPNCLMLSAHYDTKSLTYGTFDGTVGVGVAFQILERISKMKDKLEYCFLVNFNNGEELYLWGAASLVETEYKKRIKGFINLDAGGYNGRPILFRANSLPLLRRFRKNARFPHSNAIVTDILSKRLIPSDTDFTVYGTQNGLPGLDIAFYKHRSIYHTMKDSFDRIDPNSVQNLGGNLLPLIIDVLQTEQSLSDSSVAPDAVFFDILALFMIVMSNRLFTFLSFGMLLVQLYLFRHLTGSKSILLRNLLVIFLALLGHMVTMFIVFAYIIPSAVLYGKNWIFALVGVFCTFAWIEVFHYTSVAFISKEPMDWISSLYSFSLLCSVISLVLVFFEFRFAYLFGVLGFFSTLGTGAFRLIQRIPNAYELTSTEYLEIAQSDSDDLNESSSLLNRAKSHRAIFTGAIKEVYILLRQCDVFIYFLLAVTVPFLIFTDTVLTLVDAMTGTITEFESGGIIGLIIAVLSFFGAIGFSSVSIKVPYHRSIAAGSSLAVVVVVLACCFQFPYSEWFPLQVNYAEMHLAENSTCSLYAFLPMADFRHQAITTLGTPVKQDEHTLIFAVPPIEFKVGGQLPYVIQSDSKWWNVTLTDTFLLVINTSCDYQISIPYEQSPRKGSPMQMLMIQDNAVVSFPRQKECSAVLKTGVDDPSYVPALGKLLNVAYPWVTFRKIKRDVQWYYGEVATIVRGYQLSWQDGQ